MLCLALHQVSSNLNIPEYQCSVESNSHVNNKSDINKSIRGGLFFYYSVSFFLNYSSSSTTVQNGHLSSLLLYIEVNAFSPDMFSVHLLPQNRTICIWTILSMTTIKSVSYLYSKNDLILNSTLKITFGLDRGKSLSSDSEKNKTEA